MGMERSDLELFLITSVSHFTQFNTLLFNNNNVFYSLIFWVLPQYILISYFSYKRFTGVLLFCLFNVIGSLFKKVFAYMNRRKIAKKRLLEEFNEPEKELCIEKETLDKKVVKNGYKRQYINKKKEWDTLIDTFDYMRSAMLLMVIISTFACDFEFFPRENLKKEYFGISLMDIGIGSFLVCNGFFSIQNRNNMNKDSKNSLFKYLNPFNYRHPNNIFQDRNIKSFIKLHILGYIRLLTIQSFNYKVEITEYGKH